jgi:hypothetical protein
MKKPTKDFANPLILKYIKNFSVLLLVGKKTHESRIN